MNKALLFIPHYNDLDGLMRSLASIPKNAKVDVLIIDDASTHTFESEKVQSILTKKKLQAKIICNSYNLGITKNRNKCLDYVRNHQYDYTLFLDSGDTMHPNRINSQIQFMEKTPNCMMAGNFVHFVDNNGNKIFDFTPPTQWKELKKKMYFNTQLIQSSIILRNKVLEDTPYFPSEFDAAEDYAFFMEICQKHQINNIPEFLTIYFINLKSISNTKRKQQVISRMRIILKHFKWGYYPIIGLLRSLVLMFIPFHITAKIKGLVYGKK